MLTRGLTHKVGARLLDTIPMGGAPEHLLPSILQALTPVYICERDHGGGRVVADPELLI